MEKENKFSIQNAQYSFPYHYLVDFEYFSSTKRLYWGIEYYAYVSYVIELIETSSYKTLLDIGCGDGKLISLLAPQHEDKTYVGCDLSEASIFLAKGMNYNYKNAVFKCESFVEERNAYDIISLVEVLEHIADEEVNNFCDAIVRKLNKGGKLVVCVPSVNVQPVKAKHYRHYDLNMVVESFKQLRLTHNHFSVKNTVSFKLLMKIMNTFPFRRIERLINYISKIYISNAKHDNCRHIICVFEKQN